MHARMLKTATVVQGQYYEFACQGLRVELERRHTDLHRIPAEEEAGQNRLAKSKHRTKSREEADGGDAQQIDEEDG